jgi:hypothetical protein
MTEALTTASQAAGAGARPAHPGFEVRDPGFAAALGAAPRLVVKGDGTIWFTNPSYFYLQGFRG